MPYLLIAPFFLLFAVFGLYPLGRTLWVSLHDWSLLGSHSWVGLDNYVQLATDERFWNAVRNTLGIFVLSTVPQLTLALVLAHVLNRRLRARTFFRLGVLIPNVTSVAAVGIIFTLIFARDFGIANWLLEAVGVDGIDWQSGRLSSWTAISVMVDWRWTGYNALILLAAMQAVPRDVYEAAALDGAGSWRQFWSITVPLIRPTLIFVVIVATIGGMQLFTEPLLFNAGAGATGGRHAAPVPDHGDVPGRGGVPGAGLRLRRGHRLGAVPPHRGRVGGQPLADHPHPVGRVRGPTMTQQLATVPVVAVPRKRSWRRSARGASSRLWSASPLTYVGLIVAIGAVGGPAVVHGRHGLAAQRRHHQHPAAADARRPARRQHLAGPRQRGRDVRPGPAQQPDRGRRLHRLGGPAVEHGRASRSRSCGSAAAVPCCSW